MIKRCNNYSNAPNLCAWGLTDMASYTWVNQDFYKVRIVVNWRGDDPTGEKTTGSEISII